MRLAPVRSVGLLRRLRRDIGGVAAVEFALIAPIMILLYCGMAELASGIMAARKTSHATSTVGDLVGQKTTVSASDMYNLFLAASDTMTPFPLTDGSGATVLLSRITSLSVRSNGAIQVDWSCTPTNTSQSAGMPPLVTNSVVTGVPANLLNTSTPGDSVVESDGAYQFTPPSNRIFPTGLKFTDTFYFKPRASTSVTYNTSSTGSTATCNPSS